MSNFAPLKDTWTSSSSLRMSSWDPYPEFKSQDCYPQNIEGYKARENYGCGGGCSSGSAVNYNTLPNQINSNYIPLQASVPMLGSRENYNSTCCNTNVSGFQTLDQTWLTQKSYSWE